MQEKWFHLNWNILRHHDFYWLQELCGSRGRIGQYPKYMWPVIPCDLTQQSGLRQKKKQIEFQLPLGTSSTQILLALGKYLSRKIRQHFLGALNSASVHLRLTVCKIMLSPISRILPLILSKNNSLKILVYNTKMVNNTKRRSKTFYCYEFPSPKTVLKNIENKD